jgi:hypothetical protein
MRLAFAAFGFNDRAKVQKTRVELNTYLNVVATPVLLCYGFHYSYESL